MSKSVGNTLICCAAKIGAGQRRDHRAERERHQLDPVDRDRHRRRGERVFAHCPPGAAGARGVEQLQHAHRQHQQDHRAGRSSPVLVVSVMSEDADRVDPDDPVGTAELAGSDVVGELDERLAEEQRDDRQVVADQPPRRPARRAARGPPRRSSRSAPTRSRAGGCRPRRAGSRTAARSRRRRSRRTRRSRGRAARPSPPTMFSPTASIASSSALIPTCSWKSPRPSSGSAARPAAATASLGHQPTRSNCALDRAEPGRQVLAPLCLPGDPLVDPDLRAGRRRAAARGSRRRHTFCSCARPSRPLGRTSITTISSPNTSRLVYVEEM